MSSFETMGINFAHVLEIAILKQRLIVENYGVILPIRQVTI